MYIEEFALTFGVPSPEQYLSDEVECHLFIIRRFHSDDVLDDLTCDELNKTHYEQVVEGQCIHPSDSFY